MFDPTRSYGLDLRGNPPPDVVVLSRHFLEAVSHFVEAEYDVPRDVTENLIDEKYPTSLLVIASTAMIDVLTIGVEDMVEKSRILYDHWEGYTVDNGPMGEDCADCPIWETCDSPQAIAYRELIVKGLIEGPEASDATSRDDESDLDDFEEFLRGLFGNLGEDPDSDE